MNEAEFWELIERASAASGRDPDKKMDSLKVELEKLSLEALVKYDNIHDEKKEAAYRWDMWGAAYILGGGCSDDAFMDFRSWLICCGKEVYESAMENPDSLADFPFSQLNEDPFTEGYRYIPWEVYEEKTGRELPPPKSSGQDATGSWEPAGEPWDEDRPSTLKKICPRLYEKYDPHGLDYLDAETEKARTGSGFRRNVIIVLIVAGIVGTVTLIRVIFAVETAPLEHKIERVQKLVDDATAPPPEITCDLSVTRFTIRAHGGLATLVTMEDGVLGEGDREGLLIIPLFNHLKTISSGGGGSVSSAGEMPRNVSLDIKVDPKISYDLLTRVLYSAGEVGFCRFNLLDSANGDTVYPTGLCPPGSDTPTLTEDDDGLGFTVMVAREGMFFKVKPGMESSWMNPLKEPEVPLEDGVYNWDEFGRLLAKMKEEHPDKTRVNLGVEVEMPVSVLFAAMDRVRGTVAKPLFPIIVLTRTPLE